MNRDETFRRTWTLPGRLRDFLVVRRLDLRDDDEIIVDRLALSVDLDWWLQDPVFQRTLIEIWESSSLFPLTQTGLFTRAELIRFLKPRLEELFLQGPMTLVRAPRTIRSWGEPGEDEEEVAKKAPVSPKTELTWIEIQLVDEQDRPVPSEQYSIELPDGSVRNGSLDANGLARLDGLQPGTCKVTFPRLDGREWRPA
jgi:hypothetical protein